MTSKPDRDEIAKVSVKPITDRLANMAKEMRERYCREKCGEVCDKPDALLLLNKLFDKLWENYARWN